MEKLSLVNRMQKHLQENGSLQIIELTKILNNDDGYKKVTRNTVNTLLYTVKDKFKKVGYGRFNVLNGDDKIIEINIIRKMISYDSMMIDEINFSKKELKIINKLKKQNKL